MNTPGNPSPMMEQYRRIKAALPENSILLLKLGDYYEAFFDDAELMARLLGLVVTHRGYVPMCAFGAWCKVKSCGALIKAGYKVAIYDAS